MFAALPNRWILMKLFIHLGAALTSRNDWAAQLPWIKFGLKFKSKLLTWWAATMNGGDNAISESAKGLKRWPKWRLKMRLAAQSAGIDGSTSSVYSGLKSPRWDSDMQILPSSWNVCHAIRFKLATLWWLVAFRVTTCAFPAVFPTDDVAPQWKVALLSLPAASLAVRLTTLLVWSHGGRFEMGRPACCFFLGNEIKAAARDCCRWWERDASQRALIAVSKPPASYCRLFGVWVSPRSCVNSTPPLCASQLVGGKWWKSARLWAQRAFSLWVWHLSWKSDS